MRAAMWALLGVLLIAFGRDCGAWCPLAWDHEENTPNRTEWMEVEECWSPSDPTNCAAHRLDCYYVGTGAKPHWYCPHSFHTDPTGPVLEAGHARGDVTYRVRACREVLTMQGSGADVSLDVEVSCSPWSNMETCEAGPVQELP